MDQRARRNILIALAVGAALVPVFAYADTISDLQTQVQSLIAEITQLQGSLSATPSAAQTVPQSSSASVSTPSVCPMIQESLAPGSSGSDVANLQAFLAGQGLFHANVTAYFGSITEAAVQDWQIAHGIVSSGTPASTGFGAVGPRTAAAIAASCGPTSSSPQQVSCLPASPPTAECSTGWQAVTDGAGCTTSYQCAIPLPGAVSLSGSCIAGYTYENGECIPSVPTACPAIAIMCPAGEQVQYNGCAQSCVAD